MDRCRILDEEGHPVVGRLLLELRDVERQGSRARFRGALRSLGALLGYEIAKTLSTRLEVVQTPLGSREEPVLAEVPVVAAVLRAALPLWEGMLDMLPEADTMILGAARREGRLESGSLDMAVDLDYAALTPLEGRTLIYADPMIATGSTLRKIHALVCKEVGPPARVIVAGVVGYRAALPGVQEALAGAEIILASADEELNEQGYIVPGLGDAGDLAMGPKISRG